MKDLAPLYPMLLLTIVGVVVALLATARKRAPLPVLGWITTVGAVGALVLDWMAPDATPWNTMLRFDVTSRAFDTVFLVVLALVALASTSIEGRIRFAGEYYALLTFSAIGMMVMSASGGLLALYLGIELSTMCLYTLVGISKRDSRSVEAAVKLYVLGAVASGVLLYGISIIFGALGATGFTEMATALADPRSGGVTPILWLGIAFVIGGLAFKMSAAPFHLWTPDVYEGAPPAVTGFLSTASKTAAFVGALRFLLCGVYGAGEIWIVTVVALSAASMVAGNLAALAQTNLKRLFAYSGIAQAGYLLVALAGSHAHPRIGIGALWVYLMLYALTNVAGFLVIQAIVEATGSDDIDALRGLHRRSPLLATASLVVLFSLGGIPPLAGFFGKLYLFAAGWYGGQQGLVVLGVITSVIALYYYLTVACQVYIRDPEGDAPIRVSPPLAVSIILCTLGVLAIGIYPRPWVVLGDEAAQAVIGTMPAVQRMHMPAGGSMHGTPHGMPMNPHGASEPHTP